MAEHGRGVTDENREKEDLRSRPAVPLLHFHHNENEHRRGV